MQAYIFNALILLGVAVMTLGVVGLIRMPDVYTKLHAASKSVFLGVMMIALSGGAVGGIGINSRLLLICLALTVTTPVASHVVGRAAFLRHEQMETEGAVDESGILKSSEEQPSWRI